MSELEKFVDNLMYQKNELAKREASKIYIREDDFNKLSLFERNALKVLAKLYGLIRVGGDFKYGDFVNLIRELTKYKSDPEKSYLLSLFFPERVKISQSILPYPIPTYTYTQNVSSYIGANLLGNFLIQVVCPAFYVSSQSNTKSNMYICTSDDLTGQTTLTNGFVADLKTNAPDLVFQTCILQALKITVKYSGRWDIMSGFFGGSQHISTVNIDEPDYLTTDFNYIDDSMSAVKVFNIMDGISVIYYPADYSYLNFSRVPSVVNNSVTNMRLNIYGKSLPPALLGASNITVTYNAIWNVIPTSRFSDLLPTENGPNLDLLDIYELGSVVPKGDISVINNNQMELVDRFANLPGNVRRDVLNDYEAYKNSKIDESRITNNVLDLVNKIYNNNSKKIDYVIDPSIIDKYIKDNYPNEYNKINKKEEEENKKKDNDKPVKPYIDPSAWEKQIEKDSDYVERVRREKVKKMLEFEDYEGGYENAEEFKDKETGLYKCKVTGKKKTAEEIEKDLIFDEKNINKGEVINNCTREMNAIKIKLNEIANNYTNANIDMSYITSLVYDKIPEICRSLLPQLWSDIELLFNTITKLTNIKDCTTDVDKFNQKMIEIYGNSSSKFDEKMFDENYNSIKELCKGYKIISKDDIYKKREEDKCSKDIDSYNSLAESYYDYKTAFQESKLQDLYSEINRRCIRLEKATKMIDVNQINNERKKRKCSDFKDYLNDLATNKEVVKLTNEEIKDMYGDCDVEIRNYNKIKDEGCSRANQLLTDIIDGSINKDQNKVDRTRQNLATICTDDEIIKFINDLLSSNEFNKFVNAARNMYVSLNSITEDKGNGNKLLESSYIGDEIIQNLINIFDKYNSNNPKYIFNQSLTISQIKSIDDKYINLYAEYLTNFLNTHYESNKVILQSEKFYDNLLKTSVYIIKKIPYNKVWYFYLIKDLINSRIPSYLMLLGGQKRVEFPSGVFNISRIYDAANIFYTEIDRLLSYMNEGFKEVKFYTKNINSNKTDSEVLFYYIANVYIIEYLNKNQYKSNLDNIEITATDPIVSYYMLFYAFGMNNNASKYISEAMSKLGEVLNLVKEIHKTLIKGTYFPDTFVNIAAYKKIQSIYQNNRQTIRNLNSMSKFSALDNENDLNQFLYSVVSKVILYKGNEKLNVYSPAEWVNQYFNLNKMK
jgi:hypothetical protein